MWRTVKWAVPTLLISMSAVGCGSQNAAAPVTVTVSTTVTDIKTVAEVQTAIVAPPAEVRTVTTVVTQTVTLAGTTVTLTAGTVAGGATPQTAGTVAGSNGSYLSFDSAKVAANVRKLLTAAPPAGYGITGVTDTSCPNDQPVKTGTTFLCHATIDNGSKSIKITVQDSAGEYQVGLPQ